ncbi:MAG: hypothetical protein IT305_25400 [Chloroflexi bacterium]|nr:hypothetical protein [Chloroflexota bacterium]
MFESILPSTMAGLLVAFEPCFTAPSYRTFGLLVAGVPTNPRLRALEARADVRRGPLAIRADRRYG